MAESFQKLSEGEIAQWINDSVDGKVVRIFIIDTFHDREMLCPAFLSSCPKKFYCTWERNERIWLYSSKIHCNFQLGKHFGQEFPKYPTTFEILGRSSCTKTHLVLIAFSSLLQTIDLSSLLQTRTSLSLESYYETCYSARSLAKETWCYMINANSSCREW